MNTFKEFTGFTELIESKLDVNSLKRLNQEHSNLEILQIEPLRSMIRHIDSIIDLELIDFLYINYDTIYDSERKLYIKKIIEVINNIYEEYNFGRLTIKELVDDLESSNYKLYYEILEKITDVVRRYNDDLFYLYRIIKNFIWLKYRK